MGSEVVSFEESVKLRLKSIVAELIPEDRWEGLVQKAVIDFERNDLPKLVKTELTEMYKAKINAVFADPDWQQTYGGSAQPQASEALKKLLIEAAPDMFVAMMGNASQIVLQNFRQQLQNVRY